MQQYRNSHAAFLLTIREQYAVARGGKLISGDDGGWGCGSSNSRPNKPSSRRRSRCRSGLTAAPSTSWPLKSETEGPPPPGKITIKQTSTHASEVQIGLTDPPSPPRRPPAEGMKAGAPRVLGLSDPCIYREHEIPVDPTTLRASDATKHVLIVVYPLFFFSLIIMITDHLPEIRKYGRIYHTLTKWTEHEYQHHMVAFTVLL